MTMPSDEERSDLADEIYAHWQPYDQSAVLALLRSHEARILEEIARRAEERAEECVDPSGVAVFREFAAEIRSLKDVGTPT